MQGRPCLLDAGFGGPTPLCNLTFQRNLVAVRLPGQPYAHTGTRERLLVDQLGCSVAWSMAIAMLEPWLTLYCICMTRVVQAPKVCL
jgi:hypothetical protein